MGESVTQVLQPRANRARRAVLATDLAFLDITEQALAVLRAVPAWWSRRAAECGLTGDAADVGAAVSMAAPVDLAPGDGSSGLERPDLLDAAPEALADAYVLALDPHVRTRHGRHYTPALLAQSLWEQTIEALGEEPDGLVLDPACGAGVLLLPPLRAWLKARQDSQPDLVLAAAPSAISGTDLDAAAVWLGSVLLAAELLPVWAHIPADRRRPLPALLRVADGLSGEPGSAAAVVMNPPYGRVRLDPTARVRWAHAVTGHANLYGLFLAAALERVGPGGVISALVPAGWLGGAYFQRLRDLLAQRAPLRRLTFVTERGGVFSSGVLQETVLATFLANADRSLPAQVDRLAVNGHADRRHVGSGSQPTHGDLPWLLPRQTADLPLVAAAGQMSHRLADYGWRCSTGPLVWNRIKDRISARPRRGSVRIIWAADIDGGTVHRDRRRDSQRYLQVTSAREGEVFLLDRPAVLLQRTTAPEQQRRLVAAVLDNDTLDAWGGRVVVENHVNVLRSADPESVLTPRLLAALLDHPVVDRLYRCLTGSVAVSAYEIGALPLPQPDVLAEWQVLDDVALVQAISTAYGLPGD